VGQISKSDAGRAPAISILLCLYNGERYLAATIDSALAQSYRDFELIVVDDGSTDRSGLLLESYRDPRLRVVRQENRGTAAALDTGLKIATGTYIAFLDQDDLWEKDHLAAHIELLERRPHIDLSFSWFRVIDDATRDTGVRSSRYHGTIDFRGLLTDFVIGGTSNVVVRRAAIERAGGVDAAFPRVYDLDLCLRIAQLSPHNIEAIPRDLMCYRRHPRQISRALEPLQREWQQVLEKMRHRMPREVAEVEHRARSNMSRYFARLAYEDGRYRTGLGLLWDGFRHAPAPFIADSRNWLTGAACLSGLILPERLHQGLERLAGFRRGQHERTSLPPVS
jgi:glycosyltransferase involved in cell wall biosynthesis